MTTTLSDIVSSDAPIALLIGNGINRHKSNGRVPGWEQFLARLAEKQGVKIDQYRASELSNTEFYDILDLAKPNDDRGSLQRQFCELMNEWEPTEHHATLVNWARRRSAPILTVNFDANLSRAADVQCFGPAKGFTDFYPWSSYYSEARIKSVRESFAIWHAHGMMRYSRSIRLGLMHYMGAAYRARALVYGKRGLYRASDSEHFNWEGASTWLDILFFSPLLILGFGFGKDETFLRWLFLERARFYKTRPRWKQPTWYVAKRSDTIESRNIFLHSLGINVITTESYDEMYENAGWRC